eukprot:SAG31_NODE_32313_length_357_cov_0.992248_1_plen_84_part_01
MLGFTQVEDPFNLLNLWGMLGGALAVIDLTAGLLLLGLKPAFRCCEKFGADATSLPEREGTGVVQLTPTLVDPTSKGMVFHPIC